MGFLASPSEVMNCNESIEDEGFPCAFIQNMEYGDALRERLLGLRSGVGHKGNWTSILLSEIAHLQENLTKRTNHSVPEDGRRYDPPPPSGCGSFEFEYVDFSQITWVQVSIACVYCLVMALAVLGNSLVIWTVVSKKHMRTVTNCYILNLAVADLLVSSVAVPLKLLEYTAPCSWNVFSTDFLCALLYYIEPVIVFTGVLTLVAISVERYYAVVHPFSAVREDNKKRMRKIIAATWLVPLVLGSPFLFAKRQPFTIYSHHGHLSLQICTDRFDEVDVLILGQSKQQSGIFRRTYFIFLFVVIYLIPTLSIGGACVKILSCLCRTSTKQDLNNGYERLVRKREKNKRKVARMVMIVAIAFVVSWTPFYLVTFISQVQTRSFLQDSNFIFTMLCTHLLGFINSCINPFIYSRMSDKFRRSFRMALVALFCCFCKRLAPKRRRFRSSLEWNQPGHNEVVHYRVPDKARKTDAVKTSSAYILTTKSSTKTRSKALVASLKRQMPIGLAQHQLQPQPRDV